MKIYGWGPSLFTAEILVDLILFLFGIFDIYRAGLGLCNDVNDDILGLLMCILTCLCILDWFGVGARIFGLIWAYIICGLVVIYIICYDWVGAING